LAIVGASLALAQFGEAAPKDKGAPPGLAKEPKDDKGKKPKKDPESLHADNPGHGHEASEKGRDARDEKPGKPEDGPPGLMGKSPGQPGASGDEKDGNDGQRLSELIQKEKDGALSEAEKTELDGLRAHPPMGLGHGRAARKARTEELAQKQSSGKLSDDEKSELERLQKKRDRFDGLEKKHETSKVDRDKRRLDSKRQALKSFPGYEKNAPARDEFKKHARRLAQLQRAKDVADADERIEQVARIDKLIAKENQRHDTWMAKHAAPPPGANP
jgi:uncharacterized protein YnzC (UPF0291/DUF896 family)